jgi:hypothetical protein
MNRSLTLALTACIAVAGPSAAIAKSKVKIFRATLKPIAGSPYQSVTGSSKVVDNNRRDTAAITIKGLLKPGSTYTWSIYRAVGTAPACAAISRGETFTDFRYKDLTASATGTAKATVKSKTFRAFTTKRYVVTVSDSNGDVVACGQLKRAKK